MYSICTICVGQSFKHLSDLNNALLLYLCELKRTCIFISYLTVLIFFSTSSVLAVILLLCRFCGD